MKQLFALISRNQKVFFKDKGMVFSSMITPMILILLYATFLFNVYKDSFNSSVPDFLNISEKLINGTVACQLTSALLAVSCVTVSFCVNLTMVQDKVTGARKDFLVTPINKSILNISYFISTFLNALIINGIALIICFIYIKRMGWYLSGMDVVLTILDMILFVLFGTALSSLICLPLSTQGQRSAVGTIISAGYGFIAGAYMPISSFGSSLQKVLSFIPTTYTSSLIKSHMLRGVFEEMKANGIPKDIVYEIGTALDCHPTFLSYTIDVKGMYIIIIGTIMICTVLYLSIANMKKG